jgi:isopentenyl phosphate kinase
MNKTASPVDPGGLMEFSVVFTDRSLNHMSKAFQGVMNDLNALLREVYQADAAIIVPGGGTFGMEAVARQFASEAKGHGDPQRLVLLSLDADLRKG